MSPEVLAVLLLSFGAILLFVTEALRVDVVALLVMVALALSGLVTLPEALSGFSNPATATVAAMFILSAALKESGLVEASGSFLGRTLARWPVLLYASLLIGTATVSAFVNNTAAVAVLIPLVAGLGASRGLHPGRFLMPISFASQMGGMCTLIGTSTNILVSELAVGAGQPPFGMFEFAGLGLCFCAAGVAYLLVVPPFLLRSPAPEGQLLLGIRPRQDYLAELEVPPGSPAGGLPYSSTAAGKAEGLEVLALVRDGETQGRPVPDTVVEEGDRILVRGPREEILRIGRAPGLRLRRDLEGADGGEGKAAAEGEGDGPDRGGFVLVEAFVPAGSAQDGRTLRETAFQRRHRCTVLALRHRRHLRADHLGNVPLSVGDVLLVQGRRADVEELRSGGEVVPIEEVTVPRVDWRKALLAVGVLAAVVGVAAADLAPVLLAALGGCLVLAIAGTISMERAYAAVDGRTILLLAGVIPLGVALEKTGAAGLAGRAIEDVLGPWGPVVLVAGTYLVASLMSDFMSNAATAVLLVPPAIAAAQALGLDPRPLLVAVAFGASSSFMTPVGYQTNAMVMGPGGYRFRDYLRVGAPLNLLFCILAAWAIPRFFPFR